MAKEVVVRFGLDKEFLWEAASVAKNIITWAQDRDDERERKRLEREAQQNQQNQGNQSQ